MTILMVMVDVYKRQALGFQDISNDETIFGFEYIIIQTHP